MPPRFATSAKRFVGFVLPAIFALSHAAAEPGISEKEIKIGIVNDTSGKIASTGKAMNAGLKAAFEAVNAKGGINGRKIVSVIRDDGYDPLKTVSLTKELVETEKVFALCGYNAASTVKAAFLYLKSAHPEIPFLFPRSGDNALREHEYKNIFNLRGSYRDEIETQLKEMSRRGKTRVAFLSQADQLGQEVRAASVAALKTAGLFDDKKQSTPFVVDVTSARDATDMKRSYAQLDKASPDVVILGINPKDGASVIKMAAAGGKHWIFLATSLSSALGAELAGFDSPIEIVMSQALPGPDAQLPLAKEFQDDLAKIGEQSKSGYLALEGYLEGRIVAEALKRAGASPTRESFLKGLEGEPFDIGGFSINWSASEHNAPSRVILTRLNGNKIVPYEAK